ncbi:MAG: hypothetical protein NT062_38325 [Proteobacteria bacterium]|nr:hypothetical protein [Pseudomonadota bacterium]
MLPGEGPRRPEPHVHRRVAARRTQRRARRGHERELATTEAPERDRGGLAHRGIVGRQRPREHPLRPGATRPTDRLHDLRGGHDRGDGNEGRGQPRDRRRLELVERGRDPERARRRVDDAAIRIVERGDQRRERRGAADPAEPAQRERAYGGRPAGGQRDELGLAAATDRLRSRDPDPDRGIVDGAGRSKGVAPGDWTTEQRNGSDDREHVHAHRARYMPSIEAPRAA